MGVTMKKLIFFILEKSDLKVKNLGVSCLSLHVKLTWCGQMEKFDIFPRKY